MDKLSSLASVSATRDVLKRHGLYTKHELGQNFLINDDIVRKIVDLAELSSDDYVLEVGPGIGTLTEALLKSSKRVVAIERDYDLPAVLAQTLAPWKDSFALVNKDALDMQQEDLAASDGSLPSKFVSNLPYAVAATVVLDVFERIDCIQSATIMVQKEVADRMCADAGNKNYGAYTVKLGMYATPQGRFAVSPGNFFPPPHVESAVLRLDRHMPADAEGKPLTPALRAATCTMADAAFTNRRKTIANSCKAYFSSKNDARTAALLGGIFEEAGIDARRRGETLDQQEFIALGAAYLRSIENA